ncbi:ATP-binding protein [Patescibacteria group bacterium]|nr:ATP-binding protein [Patescibacteria group bacterium]
MPIQTQRRWLVTDNEALKRFLSLVVIDPSKSLEFQDWFFFPDPMNPLHYQRIRWDGKSLKMTIKKNLGQGRRDHVVSELPNTLETRRLLGTPRTVKQRLALWNPKDDKEITLDIYRQPAGFAIIEWNDPPEGATAEQLPAKLQELGLVEVTLSLTAAYIANLPLIGSDVEALARVRELLSPRVRMIPFTGAPCSGKSTLLQILSKDPLVHCVPEIASIILSQLGAKPFGSPDHTAQFQITVRATQLHFEGLARSQAFLDGKEVVALDRGTADGAAYLRGGVSEYEALFRVSYTEELERYSQGVIQLALPPREIYDKMRFNNPARTETYDQALALEQRIREAWSPHPDYVFISGDTWAEKERRALEAFQHMYK